MQVRSERDANERVGGEIPHIEKHNYSRVTVESIVRMRRKGRIQVSEVGMLVIPMLRQGVSIIASSYVGRLMCA